MLLLGSDLDCLEYEALQAEQVESIILLDDHFLGYYLVEKTLD